MDIIALLVIRSIKHPIYFSSGCRHLPNHEKLLVHLLFHVFCDCSSYNRRCGSIIITELIDIIQFPTYIAIVVKYGTMSSTRDMWKDKYSLGERTMVSIWEIW